MQRRRRRWGKDLHFLLKVRIIVASLAPGAEADLARDQDGHLDTLRPSGGALASGPGDSFQADTVLTLLMTYSSCCWQNIFLLGVKWRVYKQNWKHRRLLVNSLGLIRIGVQLMHSGLGRSLYDWKANSKQHTLPIRGKVAGNTCVWRDVRTVQAEWKDRFGELSGFVQFCAVMESISEKLGKSVFSPVSSFSFSISFPTWLCI